MSYSYVYLLENHVGKHHYVGHTDNLKSRLAEHNHGKVIHTQKFAPWSIAVAVASTKETKAIAFEKYLKSHSGRTFAQRHF